MNPHATAASRRLPLNPFVNVFLSAFASAAASMLAVGVLAIVVSAAIGV